MWEYKVDFIALFEFDGERGLPKTKLSREDEIEKRLNELGRDGWELVSISEDFLNGKCVDAYAIFKRKKSK